MTRTISMSADGTHAVLRGERGIEIVETAGDARRCLDLACPGDFVCAGQHVWRIAPDRVRCDPFDGGQGLELAHQWNGEPLRAEPGARARSVLVPGAVRFELTSGAIRALAHRGAAVDLAESVHLVPRGESLVDATSFLGGRALALLVTAGDALQAIVVERRGRIVHRIALPRASGWVPAPGRGLLVGIADGGDEL